MSEQRPSVCAEFNTVWHCQEPESGTSYQVTEEHWGLSGRSRAVRYIYGWKYATRTAARRATA